MEHPEPQTEDTKPGDPPKEEWGENPERQGPDGDEQGPTDAPTPEEADQGPSGPPPESIPGDSGEAPNPAQN